MTVLVTGAAGFIGAHVARALLARGQRVVGIDNLNSYYDVGLKRARLAWLQTRPGFVFHAGDIADRVAMEALVADERGTTAIVHLAAQAGVRYSMVDPYAYVASNVLGHVTVLEAARRLPGLRHLVYASSSSVYGGNTTMPFSETDRVDHPRSLYAATKRADEMISESYAHLYGIPLTGLRFFTVYGPWGRPDMAYFSFARAILAGEPITVYDEGRPRRDFTYIDDIVAGVLACLDHPPRGHRILNIGNNKHDSVAALVGLLETALGRRAIVRAAALPAADVMQTWASLEAIEALTGFRPTTSLAEGVGRFARWFLAWHGQVA